jgi:hypothetical protein
VFGTARRGRGTYRRRAKHGLPGSCIQETVDNPNNAVLYLERFLEEYGFKKRIAVITIISNRGVRVSIEGEPVHAAPIASVYHIGSRAVHTVQAQARGAREFRHGCVLNSRIAIGRHAVAPDLSMD